MAKGTVLKSLLWLLSLPQIFVSLLIEALAPNYLSADLRRCITIARRHGGDVPLCFVEALVIAEDHRNDQHLGIDPIAFLRALWATLYSGDIQGASTIEQQFVRVVTGRYERTARRKLREQVLALMIVRSVSKREIASAYLCIAFFGSGSVGIHGLKARFGDDLSKVSFVQALRMIAQLKYPQPLSPGFEWHERLETRCQYLMNRIENATNNTLDSDPVSDVL